MQDYEQTTPERNDGDLSFPIWNHSWLLTKDLERMISIDKNLTIQINIIT